ncbi:MAG: hypothetical protein ABF271_14440 [Abyssibacter sp.]|uniref:hypothetical protein n=1 Tax=Abyssibacter sp. TaxID=2320200 RepID=UPI002EBA46D7|nr:hypothetical protein [Pseudomonadota bacterium]
MTDSTRIALAPTAWLTYLWLVGLGLLLPLAYWLIAGLVGLPEFGLVIAAAVGMLAASLSIWMARASRVVIDQGRLELNAGGVFRHSLALDALQLDQVQIHYPPRQLGHMLGPRGRGLSLPGVHLGWFAMPYGRVFVVGPAPTPVLEIRTAGGGLLLAVDNPQDALTRLHAARR